MKEKDQDRSIFKEILGWLVYIAILLAAVYVLITMWDSGQKSADILWNRHCNMETI